MIMKLTKLSLYNTYIYAHCTYNEIHNLEHESYTKSKNSLKIKLKNQNINLSYSLNFY